MNHSQTRSVTEHDPLWYKDAVIYEVHVRAFLDSNADGMGDFRGLAEKLDYLEDLGVTAIWLLPFFPSPWRDDGYDISDFRTVHPAYGTLRDFQTFLKEAHRRGLKVITELVINHTSDQHVWFQNSRKAEPGSSWRDFYVWSDSPDKYAGTRIIFKDFEPSNWTWDPVAKAYYWHRFFSHQPDLNFNSPLVRRAVMKTLDFWAGMGVDAFRLDAIPYLFEREGTSSENLPETHDFLKELRRHMDTAFPNRMFLAEANMWPEDAVAYFGKGDECQMSFHFPLMPRLFMALRLEDRLPIVDILNRTPAIPETCQWAMFLRNHDELTLEMVTDEERDYMYRMYASDQRARINLGIRRRLAPLLGNDRARIEVMNALLFSMPGTPVLYYGDEIGMGDNVYLGDRNGVRTPMQWSPDRNAGFSKSNPQQLYLPVNIDPAYHYESVNVESHSDNPYSLLNWTKRLIALRKQYKAFGRGTLEFLQPSNRHVLAFFRRYEQETILVVANLSRFAQAVELDLPNYQGYTPIEMFGRTDFPMVGESYYPLTLGPNSFFWFSLEQRTVSATVSSPVVETGRIKLPSIAVQVLADALNAANLSQIATAVKKFFPTQRWFKSKGRRFRSIEIVEAVPVVQGKFWLLFVRNDYTSGDPDTYLVPVGIAGGMEEETIRTASPDCLIAELRSSDGAGGLLYDATSNNEFLSALLDAFARRRKFGGETGELVAHRNREFRQLWGASHPNLEPSLLPSAEFNTTVKFGDRFVFKLIRNAQPGINPGVEMGQLLTEDLPKPFPNTAPFAGYLQHEPSSGEKTTVGVLHGYVQNSNDAWNHFLEKVKSFLSRYPELTGSPDLRAEIEKSLPVMVYALTSSIPAAPAIAMQLLGDSLPLAELMGKRLAEMHAVFANAVSGAAFTPEPFNDFYRQELFQGYVGLTSRRFEFIRQRYSEMPPLNQAMAAKVLEQQNAVLTAFRAIFDGRVPSVRTRYNGRLHLGHVLITQDDVVMFDFEGDPTIHVSARRIKRCPIRDVASMLISFAYATQSAVRQLAATDKTGEMTREALRPLARFWYAHINAAFIRGYWTNAKNASYMPPTEAEQQILLNTFLLERALLDVREDIEDRPDFSGMPFRIILHLLDAPAERAMGG